MFRNWFSLAAIAATTTACGSDSNDNSSAGGSAPIGGSRNTGGASAGAPSGGGPTNAGSGGRLTTAGSAGAAGAQGGAGGSAGSGGASGGMAGASGSAGVAGSAGAAGTGSGGGPSNRELVGWAAHEKTTGGGDAAPVVVDSLGALNSAASGSDPKVIHFTGKGNGTLSVGSNKTIIGMSGAEVRGGSTLRISGTNVIVRNISLIGSPNGSSDNVLLSGAKRVWLDHLDIVDGGDGLMDIVGTSDFITVSWSIIRYTGKTDHQTAVLLASSNGSGESKGHMNITFHHNWWKENVNERQPRVRFGKVHVFNNLYTATPGWTYYAVRAGYDANVRSENNIYKDFTGISEFDGGRMGQALVFNYFDGSANSVLQSFGDVFENCTERAIDGDGVEGGTFSKGTAFVPPYPYTPDPTDGLEAAIRSGAGPK